MEGGREAGRQGGRHADRQTDSSQTGRQAGREAGREGGSCTCVKNRDPCRQVGNNQCLGLMTPLWSFQGLQAKKLGPILPAACAGTAIF